ncbi:hypothetical protein BO221_11785 [Archangium sp. Cb G35]|uniref:hypothetical protein n=1 Tax=Archangium sp. Cb G35 TaxID=1920190 RepID=UPI000937A57B|nr:hypothetical protein [Archangium sp. Cb G35]OJT25055.1 hypothetical protein BO221_11785 [Archangium sp. Cb G35]
MNVSLVPGIDAVRPSDVQQYLRLKGWRPRGEPRGHVAEYVHVMEDTALKVRVLLDPAFSDYALRTAELIDVLSRFEHRAFIEILDELLIPPGDRIRFRIFSESTRSGTIALDDSIRLRVAARQLFLASAHSALKPQRHFARLSQSSALDLLRDCRETQTERGSYVTSLLVPVDPPVGGPEVEEPYARRVTRTLMGGLVETSRSVEAGEPETLLDRAQSGVSSNFLTALADMRPGGERSFVEIDMSWSRARPELVLSRSKVRFEQGVFGMFSEAARALRETTPVPGLEVEGFVVRLERPEKGPELPGEVILATQLEDYGSAKIHVRLSGADYAAATNAHRDGLQVRVFGTLTKTGRRFELQDPSGFELLADVP